MSTTTITDNVASTAARMQDKASDAFRTGRTATADGLEGAASRIAAGGDRIAEAAHSTADSLGTGANYIRTNGPREMANDIESIIKAHPGKALLGAVILGFFAGRAFRRD